MAQTPSEAAAPIGGGPGHRFLHRTERSQGPPASLALRLLCTIGRAWGAARLSRRPRRSHGLSARWVARRARANNRRSCVRANKRARGPMHVRRVAAPAAPTSKRNLAHSGGPLHACPCVRRQDSIQAPGELDL